MQGEIGFPRLGAPRAPPPSQVELVNRSRPASRPRHLPSPRPLRAPGQVKVARGAGRGRLAGPARARRAAAAAGLRRPRPGHLWRKRPLSGLSCPSAARLPPAAARPARTQPPGPSPLNWLQPAAAGRRAGEGPRRQGSGRPRAAGSPCPT